MNNIAYQTGSWTPSLLFGGSSIGITYSDVSGQYTQIGNIVFISFIINLSSKGSASGLATIAGLPIPAGSFGTRSGNMDLTQIINFTLPAGTTYISMAPHSGASNLDVVAGCNGGAGMISLTDANFSNSTQLIGSSFYFSS